MAGDLRHGRLGRLKASQKVPINCSNVLTQVMTFLSGIPDAEIRPGFLLVFVARPAVAIGVAPFFGEVSLSLKHLGRSNHFLIAASVLLKRRSCASFTGHKFYSLPAWTLSLKGADEAGRCQPQAAKQTSPPAE